jgi:hypothetical protein
LGFFWCGIYLGLESLNKAGQRKISFVNFCSFKEFNDFFKSIVLNFIDFFKLLM